MSNYEIGQICPECKDGNIVERYSSKTKQQFLGCSNYPKCKWVQSLNNNNSNYKPYFKEEANKDKFVPASASFFEINVIQQLSLIANNLKKHNEILERIATKLEDKK